MWQEFYIDRYYKISVAMTISEYFYIDHNKNNIELPEKRTEPIQGVTIAALPVLTYKHDAEQYIKRTLGGETNGFAGHYIIGVPGVYKTLPDEYAWQYETGRQNNKTICISPIISDAFPIPEMYLVAPFQHAARLTAYVLKKNKLKTTDINLTKDCPKYILDRWKEFKRIVVATYKKV